MNTDWLKVNPVRVTWILSCAFLRNWLTKLANFKKQWLSSYVSWWRYSLSFPCDTLVLWMNTVWLKVSPGESYVNPVLCVFEKLAYKVGIFHKTLAAFLRFVLSVLTEFFLQRHGSLHEHSLTEGQSSERVTWILSRAFFRNFLTKLTNFKKQWLSSYVLWWHYSLSFPCDTLVLCMNPAWLKVNPVRELRESCPVRLWEIGLQSWHISQKIGWVTTFHRGRYSLSFPCDTLVLCMNPAWLKVNPVRELRESCPARFCEIGLQSWQISKNHGWVPTFRGGSTHWVFLATPWFFAWIQLDWRSIQWLSYVNPVLCVFEKLAYKVGIFHKNLAEFLRFMGAVRIEFSLRHPGSLHESSLTVGQSSEGVTWILGLSCAFFEKLAYKVGKFQKTMAEFLRFVVAVLIEFSLRHPGSLHEHSLTEGQSSEGVTWILTGQKNTFPPPWESMWVCNGNVLNSANYLGTIRFHLHTQ